MEVKEGVWDVTLLMNMEKDLFKYIYTKYLEKANETIFFTIEEWMENMLKEGRDVTGGIIGLNIEPPEENLFTYVGGIKVYYRDPEDIGDYKYLSSYILHDIQYNRYQLNVEHFTEHLDEETFIEDIIHRAKTEIGGHMITSALYRMREKHLTGNLIVVLNSDFGISSEKESSGTTDLRFYIEVDNIKPGMDIGRVVFHLPVFQYGCASIYCK